LTISSPNHAKWLIDKKKAAKPQAARVLEQHPSKNNIETSLRSSGFSSVPDRNDFTGTFVDSFCFLSIITNSRKNGTWACIPAAGKVLQRYMRQESVNGLPADLAGSEAFVRRTLAENQKRAACMKFDAAYFRRCTSRIAP